MTKNKLPASPAQRSSRHPSIWVPRPMTSSMAGSAGSPNVSKQSSTSPAVQKLSAIVQTLAVMDAVVAAGAEVAWCDVLLAVERVHGGVAAEGQQLAARGGRAEDDHDLVAVDVLDDVGEAHRRDDQDPGGIGAIVFDAVGALGARAKRDDVPGLEPLAAVAAADGRVPGEHDEQLLVAVVDVHRRRARARAELIERGPEPLGAGLQADGRRLGLEGVGHL